MRLRRQKYDGREIDMKKQGKKSLGILLTVILMLSMTVCSAAEEKA
jgi:hypothetical protein